MKLLVLICIIAVSFVPVFANHMENNGSIPTVKDPSLKIEKFVENIPHSPTTMTFVGNDILVLERTGHVGWIKDGKLQKNSTLDLQVASDGERGLLGITSVGKKVYLYFTAADQNGKSIENRIFSYDWNGTKLINPVLLKTLPSDNFYHNGGAMANYDGQVYAVIGDNGNYGHTQNRDSPGWKNDTSVILRVDPPGPHYAMGIRNSFGIAVDPVTGHLWDTENGDDNFDEINFVPEKFNSGWIQIMGPTQNKTLVESLPKYGDFIYKNPEFSWEKTIGPTGIEFGTKQIGQEDKVFAVDCNNGNLYRFTLNSNRDGFVFNSPELQDKVLNIGEPSDEIVIGTGFGCATDIERGPDGLLYIVSLSQGIIYRLSASTSDSALSDMTNTNSYLIVSILAVIATISIILLKKFKKL